MRPDSVKKIAACRMHRMPQAVYPGSSARKGTAPHELAKAAASIAVNVGRPLMSRDDADPSAWISAMPSFSCPSGQPRLPSGRGTALGSHSRD
jgi:hypothetical protein